MLARRASLALEKVDDMSADPRVTLHLKTDRMVRDQLLGALRARGLTMQEFFDRSMRKLIHHPEYIDVMRSWYQEESEEIEVQEYAGS